MQPILLRINRLFLSFSFDCRILFQLPAWKLRYLRDTAISAAGNRTDPAALLSSSYRGRKGCYPASGRFCLRGHGDFRRESSDVCP